VSALEHEDDILARLEDALRWVYVPYVQVDVNRLALAADRLPPVGEAVIGSEAIAEVMGVSTSTAPRYRRFLHAVGLVTNVYGFRHPQGHIRHAKIMVKHAGGGDALLENVGDRQAWVLRSRVRVPASSSEGLVRSFDRDDQDPPVGVFARTARDYRDRVAVVVSHFDRDMGYPDTSYRAGSETSPVPTVLLRPAMAKGWIEFSRVWSPVAFGDNPLAAAPLGTGLRPVRDGRFALNPYPHPSRPLLDGLGRPLFEADDVMAVLDKPYSTAYRYIGKWEKANLVAKVPGTKQWRYLSAPRRSPL
jgi:hypothetical protein